MSRFHLGVRVPNGDKITVRELCNMRSGLFEAFATPQFAQLDMKVPPNFKPRMLVEWAAQKKPYFAPGKGYHYSNTNYILLGMIIEAITHDSVGNQIQTRLLNRFGLAHTSYPDTEAMPDPWARGYGLDGNRNWEDVSNTIPVAFMGSAGEMISTMSDVRRWIKLYALGKTGGPAGFRPQSECLEVPRQHGLRPGHQLQRRLAGIHRRAAGLQHRGLLQSRDRHDRGRLDYVSGSRSARGSGQRDLPRSHAHPDAGPRSFRVHAGTTPRRRLRVAPPNRVLTGCV